MSKKEIITPMKNSSNLLKNPNTVYIIFSITTFITFLSGLLPRITNDSAFYKSFNIYMFFLSLIGLSNIYLLLRINESFKKINSKYCVIDKNKKPSIITTCVVIVFCLLFFIVLYFLNSAICGYIFDEKVIFVLQTKTIVYFYVCLITNLSILLFSLYILYVVFLNKTLKVVCKKCRSVYPISNKIFLTLKDEISVSNYIYWFTIIAYLMFAFFHSFVCNGFSFNLQISGSEFAAVWIGIAFIALFGYFVFLYFPNKLICDSILKIKLKTIEQLGKKVIAHKSKSKNLLSEIQFIDNSPSMFSNYFLNKFLPIITTIATIAISLLQLNIGAA